MSVNTTTRAKFSFKKLLGKSHISNGVNFYSESRPNQVWIDSTEIVSKNIPKDPQQAVNDGLVEFVEADLSVIGASNGVGFDVLFPSNYSGFFGTSVQGDPIRDHTQIIDQKNNIDDGKAVSSHNGGYVYALEDSNGDTISVGAPEGWLLDPVSTVLTSQEEISDLDGGTVKVYVYTGQTLREELDSISTGGGFQGTTDDIVEGSTNLYFTDERAQDAALSAVTGTNGLTWTYDDAADSAEVTLSNLDSFTTDDLTEGSTNLYYTDTRVKNDFQAGGDINYNKTTLSGLFDVSTASFTDSLDVSAQDSAVNGVAFSGDGTKMFVVGGSDGRIDEFSLGTGFDVSTASFIDGFDTTNQEDFPKGVAFNGDGTKMFVVGNGNDNVYEYDLTTGFDLSTASYSGTSFDVSGEDGRPQEVVFNGDGTKMFVVGNSNETVYEYDLTTGFDLSTASYSGTSFDVSSEDGSPRGVQFNDDGTKMFVVGNGNDNVYEYDLTTGFDVSTASFSQSFDVSSEDGNPRGVQFNSDGTKMFVAGNGNDNVYEYDVGSVGGPAEFSLDVSALTPSDLFGSKTSDDLPEGSTNLYFTDERAQDAVGSILGEAFVYDDAGDQISKKVSLAARSIGQTSSNLTLDASEHRMFEFEPTSDIDVNVVGLPSNNNRKTRTYLAIKNGGDQNLTFKTDGQEDNWNWIDGNAPNLSSQNTTGSLFDLSAYSATGNDGPLSSQYARNAVGLRWGPNGNVLFAPLVDDFGDSTPSGTFIELYDAPNPYDVTNLSTSGNRLDVSNQAGAGTGDAQPNINDLVFNNDGTKIYISDSSQGQIVSYSLTSAYGSNGSFVASVDTTSSPPGSSSHTVNPKGVEFDDTGNILVVSGTDGGTGVITAYTLGSSYDITTIQSSSQIDVSANETDPRTPRFNDDGSKLFTAGEGTGTATPTVNSWTLSTSYDINTLSFENSLNTGTNEVTGIDFTPSGDILHVLDITGSPNFDNETIKEFGSSLTVVDSTDIISVHQVNGETYAEVEGLNTKTTDELPEGSTNLYFTDERAQDAVASMITGGTNVTTTYDDGTDTFTIDVPDEDIQDSVYNNVLSGTQTRITVTYDDANNEVDYVVDGDLSNYNFTSVSSDDISEGSTNLYFTDERAQDAVGNIITGSGRTTVTYDDPSGSITVETTDEAIQDAVYNNVLSGTQTLITVTYDDANDEVDYVVESDLSQYDLGNISSDDISEGSSNLYFTGERVDDRVNSLLVGGSNVTLTYDDPNDSLTIDVSGTQTNLSEDGAQVISSPTDINFTVGFDVTDDGDGTATIDLDLGEKSTDELPEGSTNLYFTDERAQDAVASMISGGANVTTTYDDATDTFTIDVPDEDVQDSVFNNVLSGTQTLITVTYDDANNEVDYVVENDLSQYDFGNISSDDISEGSSNLYFTDERAQDAAASMITGGTNVTTTYDDGTDTFTIDVPDEDIQDSVYNNVLSGTQTRITVTYDDANNEVDFVVDDDIANFDLSNVTTDDITEGSSNLYYTDTRVKNDFQAGGDITYSKNTLSGTFDLSTASFSGTSFDVGSEDGAPNGVTFNGDGTKMFIVGFSSENVYEYDLTTGFDVSTASFSGTSFDVGSEDPAPTGVAFNGDGTKMFVVGNNSDSVYEYDLTTGFDLSTASFSGSSFDVSSEDTGPQGVTFNGDGSKMFVVGASSDSVHEYDLTTGFDLSTASFSGTSFDVSSEDTGPQGVTFNGDGSKMFVVGNSGDSVYEYDLSTGFDLSTASFSGTSFNVSSEDSSPRGITFNGDGTKMFVIGNSNDKVYEYDLGTPSGPAEFSLDVSALSPSDLFGSKTSDDLPEGSSNLYFTNERVDDRVNNLLVGGSNVSLIYDDAADSLTIDISGTQANLSEDSTQVISSPTDINFTVGFDVVDDGDGTATIDLDLGEKSTDELPEGSSNLYFTDERAQDAAAAMITGGTNVTTTYDDGTDTFTIDVPDEDVQDAVYNNVLSGTQTRITVTYDDANNEVDFVVDDNIANFDLSNVTTDDISEGSSNLYFTEERAQDAAASMITGGTNVTTIYDDGTDTFTIDVPDEDIQDSIYNNVLSGTQTLINVAYDDANNEVDFVVESDLSQYDLGNISSDDISEGSSNLYFTDERVDDRVNNLLVGGSNVTLTYDDPNDSLTIDVSGTQANLSEDGAQVISSPTDINFTTGFDVVDDGDGTATVNMDLSEKSTDDLPEGSTNLYFTDERVDDRVNNLLVGGTNVGLTYDDAADSLTIDVSDENIQDAVFNNVLSGTQTLITVTYDDANNEVDFVVESDLSQYDFGNVSSDDISEGSSSLFFTEERAQDAAASMITGGTNISTSYDDATDTFTIDNDVRFGSATFSGNPPQKEFDIPHGLGSKPTSWTITAVTDDASAFSHATADATSITVVYDTVPPPGTDNLELNYSLLV